MTKRRAGLLDGRTGRFAQFVGRVLHGSHALGRNRRRALADLVSEMLGRFDALVREGTRPAGDSVSGLPGSLGSARGDLPGFPPDHFGDVAGYIDALVDRLLGGVFGAVHGLAKAGRQFAQQVLGVAHGALLQFARSMHLARDAGLDVAQNAAMTSPIEAAIFELLAREPRSIAPEQVARAVDPDGWRRTLRQVRAEAIGLARAGKLVILRHGKPADPDTLKGVWRMRLPGAEDASTAP